MPADTKQISLLGNLLPKDIGRTDEGTPVSLFDFKGRALAIFLSGENIETRLFDLANNIKDATSECLNFNCSPVLISLESENLLAAARELNNLPFMMISDFSREIHSSLNFDFSSGKSAILIADSNAKIVAVIPHMPSREQISTALAAMPRLFPQEL